MLENGMFLIERYEILSKVGVGGMADVYKAKDHVLGRIVAVKVLKAEFSEDVNFVTKFRTEAQSAAGLEHPNIVNIYDVGSENGLHFIVMEYVEGITLKTYIEKKGQLSFKEATSIAIQVARGIEIAHSKEIIHRDIKPQNVIISTEGKVKVTDFGIARAISSNTISAEVMGSVHYASPEQARNGFVDGRSDIYSLGIVMYEMVTGRVPFDGDTTVSVAIQHLQEEMVEPSVYAPELPISYEKIVLKATQKNPDRRYQTIEELLADLRKALANPEEDFVVIAPATIAKTRVIGGEELEAIQNSAKTADLEKENVYANTQDDDEFDGYDDLDDEEEEEKGIFNPIVDRIVNVVLILIAIAIVGVIIWLGSSVLDLFKPDDNGPSTPKPPVTGTTDPGTTDSETDSETGTTEDPSSEIEYAKMIDIFGLDKEKAKEFLEALGFKMNILTNVEDSGYPDGTVLSQSELKDTMLPVGTVIHVTVAGEIISDTKKEVPNVVTDEEGNLLNLDEQQAKEILYGSKFMVAIDYEYSDTVEAGYVSSQNPAAGKKVREGSVVTIYISRGKAPVEVPKDLVNREASVAIYILEQKGFTYEITYEYTNEIKPGIVTGVSYVDIATNEVYEGENIPDKIPHGSTITLLVSAKEETEEPPTGSEDTGYEFVENSILGANGATFYTFVLKDNDENGKILYEATERIAIPEDGKLKFNLTGLNSDSGIAYLEIVWYESAEGSALSVSEYSNVELKESTSAGSDPTESEDPTDSETTTESETSTEGTEPSENEEPSSGAEPQDSPSEI